MHGTNIKIKGYNKLYGNKPVVFTVKTPKHLLSLLQQKIIYSIEIALKV
jgi:hypothetical protein